MTTNDNQETRQEFVVIMAFLAPWEGAVSILADSKEHAKEIVEKQFSNRTGLVIADVYTMVEVEANSNSPIPADLLNPKLN